MGISNELYIIKLQLKKVMTIDISFGFYYVDFIGANGEWIEMGHKVRMFMDAFPDEDASALFPLASRMNKTPTDILRLIRGFRDGLGLFE